MISLKKIPRYAVWHVESDDRWELAMTFLRMQEYYESSNSDFQGKIFTHEKYMDWYVKTRPPTKQPGAFTYPADWSAFNVPGHAVRAVRDNFPELSEKERWLFGELAKGGAFTEKQFYLIGNQFGAKKFFDHEFRHALFTLCDEYRQEIRAVLAEFEVPELRTWILKNYAPSVLDDEIQAYALTGWPAKKHGIRITPEMRALVCALRKVEQKFLPA